MIDIIPCIYFVIFFPCHITITSPNAVFISYTWIIVDNDLNISVSKNRSIAATYFLPNFFHAIANKLIDEAMISMTFWPPFTDFYLCARIKTYWFIVLLGLKLIAPRFIYLL